MIIFINVPTLLMNNELREFLNMKRTSKEYFAISVNIVYSSYWSTKGTFSQHDFFSVLSFHRISKETNLRYCYG